MNAKKTLSGTGRYVTAMEYEYAGMINALSYLCQEADAAQLDYVSLHLNIAIDELKERHLPASPAKS